MRNSASLFLILILAVSVFLLFAVESVGALTKPAIPTFTVKFVGRTLRYACIHLYGCDLSSTLMSNSSRQEKLLSSP